MVDKKMQEWIKRQEGYRKWREEGHGEKILYNLQHFLNIRKALKKHMTNYLNLQSQKDYKMN